MKFRSYYHQIKIHYLPLTIYTLQMIKTFYHTHLVRQIFLFNAVRHSLVEDYARINSSACIKANIRHLLIYLTDKCTKTSNQPKNLSALMYNNFCINTNRIRRTIKKSVIIRSYLRQSIVKTIIHLILQIRVKRLLRHQSKNLKSKLRRINKKYRKNSYQ